MTPLFLAQVDPTKAMADGFGAQFLPYALAVCVLAIGFLFKMLWDQSKAHAVEIAALNKSNDTELKTLQDKKDAEIATLNAALLTQARDDAAEQRKLMAQIVPLSGQLVEMIRLTDRE